MLEGSLRQVAKEFPERLAVQIRDRRVSYGELAGIVDSLTKEFADLSGRRVLLLLPDGLPSYLWHLTLFLSGGINIPISVQAATSKIRTLCERVQPHFIVTNNPLRQRHRSALGSYPCVVIQSDDANVSWGFNYETFHGEGSPACHGLSLTREPNQIRMIVFTSGSTGEPKGVCLSEKNLLAAAEMMVSFLGLNPSRKSLVTVPLYDYYGFIQIYGHLLGRCGYLFGETIGFPDRLLKTIGEQGVTDLALVPYTLRELLRVISAKHSNPLQNLGFITSSSDLITPDLLAGVFKLNSDLRVFNIYGLTEAGRACYKEIRSTTVLSGSIGKPSPGVVIVLDTSEGEPGEIIIKGPNVMLGYLQDISGDCVVYMPCSEMRTGDLAYFDADGEIVLVGRRDHLINIRGAKIHPSEIETLALQVPGVVEAYARKETSKTGETFVSLYVVAGDGECSLQTIQAHMHRRLQPPFYPRKFNIVKGIDRTELGSKIIRREGNK